MSAFLKDWQKLFRNKEVRHVVGWTGLAFVGLGVRLLTGEPGSAATFIFGGFIGALIARWIWTGEDPPPGQG